ncbi:MAG TPA: phosphotransferase [Polyangiaceae bacterium]|jgi:aminoglycoside phosphotransferase (APT) family kinase protein|nr:phosphotransferase [Polyangiaceae bacterium]
MALADHASLLPLLPEDRVGAVEAIEPITVGLSGAGVYAVTTSRGAYVLRVGALAHDPEAFAHHLRVLRRAADAGVAPPVVHVDEGARALVSVRVRGMPLGAALANPEQRGRALSSAVDRLRALHGLDPSDVAPSDPTGYAIDRWRAYRERPGYAAWAEPVEPALERVRAILAADARRVVSHNDVNPVNLLWDGTSAWLIDWEVAGMNHPHFDLATLAMFLRLGDDVTESLLAQHDGRPPNDEARATFRALRGLAGVLCGLTFLGMVEDLAVRPAPARADAPTLLGCYEAMRAGKLDVQTPEGRATFGLALLSEGLG